MNPPCGKAAFRRRLDAPAARARFAGLGDRRHPAIIYGGLPL